MHIFSTTYFCYVQNKTKLDPHSEKGIFVGYDKQSSAYLFSRIKGDLKRLWVKFTYSYDNNSLSKQQIKQNELSDYISNTWWTSKKW